MFNAILASCLFSWAAANAIPVSSSSDQVDRKYVFSDTPGATWVGEALPGQNTTLRGTMQEIRRGIEAINPASAYLNASAEDPEGFPEGGFLEKRWTESHHWCGFGDWADRDVIRDGIRYLRTKYDGRMQCGASPGSIGHGSCSRVSCDRNGGIWLCNDNDFHLTVPCKTVGAVAERLWTQCYQMDGSETYVKGQLFTTENWNVIIRKTDC